MNGKDTTQTISCQQRDELLGDGTWEVAASLTDISGQFGDPKIHTRWEQKDTGIQISEYRYPDPDGGPDTKPCEHYKTTPAHDPTNEHDD